MQLWPYLSSLNLPLSSLPLALSLTVYNRRNMVVFNERNEITAVTVDKFLRFSNMSSYPGIEGGSERDKGG
jgi:hypothetical protein